MNIGSAMNNPAWQAIVPELVPQAEELPNAVSLAAASNNLARAVGPALGGLMVAAFVKAATGAGWVFALNAGSFAAVIFVLYVWKRKPLFKSALPAERIMGSVGNRAALTFATRPRCRLSFCVRFCSPFPSPPSGRCCR